MLDPEADWKDRVVAQEIETTVEDLIDRARDLITDDRVLLGITGPPGVGKSTITRQIVNAIGPDAATVAMDGYHLAQRVLAEHGSADRKGAPDTFDVGGYVSMLRRLREATDQAVYVPLFDRTLEEPVGSASPIDPSVRLVVTEGNYLLLQDREWSSVRGLLDQVWFIDLDRQTRIERLQQRHIEFGDTAANARRRALGSDEANAELVARTMDAADLVIRLRD